MKKLELPSPDESMSTEGILDSICTFLVTNEGKRKAALSMQEATYEKLYIQPGGQNSSQKRQEPNLPAQQAAYPFPPVAQQVLPSITNLQQQRVVQQVFNRTPDQPLPVAQESMRNQTSPPKLPEIPQSAQNNSLQPGDASFKDNSSPTLSRQPQESPIAQKEKPNCEIISSESNKEGACLAQPKLMPKIDPQKIIVPEQERVDTNIKRRISDILKVCTSPTMFSIPYDAIEFQRQSSRLCYFDIKERYINPLQSDPIQAKIMCVCSHPFVFKANMLACTFCQFLSHRECMSANSKMANFVCAQCQLLLIDPLSVPIQTITKPFLVHQIEEKDAPENQRPTFHREGLQECSISIPDLKEIRKPYTSASADTNFPFSVQLRCIRMNNTDGVFNHNLPQFGFCQVNQDFKSSNILKIGEPPNDKKRHDKILDITMQLSTTGSKNVIEILQVKKERDPFRYVCGVFIVKNLDPHDLINFVKCYQPVIPFQRGIEHVKLLLSKFDEVECMGESSVLEIDLRCSFTLTKIKTPVKGKFCEHLQCFDLDAFVKTNTKLSNRKWFCPCIRQDKPIKLFRDEFTMRLLEVARSDETKCKVNNQLEITFDKGRVFKVYGNQIVTIRFDKIFSNFFTNAPC